MRTGIRLKPAPLEGVARAYLQDVCANGEIAWGKMNLQRVRVEPSPKLLPAGKRIGAAEAARCQAERVAVGIGERSGRQRDRAERVLADDDLRNRRNRRCAVGDEMKGRLRRFAMAVVGDDEQVGSAWRRTAADEAQTISGRIIVPVRPLRWLGRENGNRQGVAVHVGEGRLFHREALGQRGNDVADGTIAPLPATGDPHLPEDGPRCRGESRDHRQVIDVRGVDVEHQVGARTQAEAVLGGQPESPAADVPVVQATDARGVARCQAAVGKGGAVVIGVGARLQRKAAASGDEAEGGLGVRRPREDIDGVGKGVAAIRIDEQVVRQTDVGDVTLVKAQPGERPVHPRRLVALADHDIEVLVGRGAVRVRRADADTGDADGVAVGDTAQATRGAVEGQPVG